MLRAYVATLWTLCANAADVAYVSQDFPIIDLGYARHAPTKINRTSVHNISYATYSNIRFAQAPVGQLHFRGPQQPPPSSEGIQDGVVPFNATNCVQTIPHYFDFLPGLNGSTWGHEDCLFLDVIVPEGVVHMGDVPVLHWIYGGGYFYGAKDNGGNPAALLDTMTPDEKFVIVASNYRLGAFGWLAAEEVPTITPNAGLYDTVAALNWTRDNIHWFGGDRSRVTVMGQSAGGGNIALMLGASAHGIDMPFSQAILSSPGYRPHINRSVETYQLYQTVLELTNCTDIQCLRACNESTLTDANKGMFLLPEDQVSGFPGPSISFGPLLDNDLVKELPEITFEAQIRDHQPIPNTVKRIIAGGMRNDGAASTIGDLKTWHDELSIFARTPTPVTVAKVKSWFGQFNASSSSFQPNGLVFATPGDVLAGDIIYACHSQLAAQAYSGTWWPGISSESYRYEMSIQPALHGQDLSYYFYDEVIRAADPTVTEEVARTMQQYFRDFVLGKDMGQWPEYSSSGDGRPSWVNITSKGFDAIVGKDEETLAERCKDIVELFSNDADGW